MAIKTHFAWNLSENSVFFIPELEILTVSQFQQIQRIRWFFFFVTAHKQLILNARTCSGKKEKQKFVCTSLKDREIGWCGKNWFGKGLPKLSQRLLEQKNLEKWSVLALWICSNRVVTRNYFCQSIRIVKIFEKGIQITDYLSTMCLCG